MDYLKLSELIKDKAKLEKYLNDTILQLNQMNGGKSSVATSNDANKKAKAEKKLNSAGALEVSEVKNGGGLNLGSTSTSGAEAIADSKSLGANASLSGKTPQMNGYLGGASQANISGLVLNGLSAKAIASVSKTSNAISRQETQVAGLTSKLGLPSNSNKSSSGGTSLSNALKVPMEKINSGLSGAKANLLFANSKNAIGKNNQDGHSGAASGSGANSMAKNNPALNARTYEIDLGNTPNRPGNTVAAKVNSDAKFPVFPTGKKGLNAKKGKYSQPDVYNSDSNEEGQESRLISSVIDARNLKNKEAFSPTEDDSLFERVTKAYIRNYEKVDDVPAVVTEEQ